MREVALYELSVSPQRVKPLSTNIFGSNALRKKIREHRPAAADAGAN